LSHGEDKWPELEAALGTGEWKPLPACDSRNTKTHELTFCAVLEDGLQEVRFERVAR
jgi:hypothetical protein